MDDKRLNDLLRWSIENSENGKADTPSATAAAAPASNLTPEIITAADVTLENKLIAFDNLEQLIESLDNANNMANLGLWTPLLAQLAHDEPQIRTMAAWCVGTAVQNNEKTQERLLAAGLATGEGESATARRKAVYALSSAIRNYQPALDAAVEELAAAGHAAEKVDATDMEAVDTIITPLREKAKGTAA
ncbi:Hsp70 nucleotide exchange factor FES1 [Beauveria bassiana D1-5]|uniref:Hsp70 nucleotide exchange factor FES1 n=1 Tax=Beauveria bassiana D1-5 TaxID=1245745 RepID=A0A0A2V8Z4_BEABA|nr:Hsp70 nucleotide exchange factor FES1 [Beauveria bassiana D1-5]